MSNSSKKNDGLESETHQASEYMKKFFNNLSELKEFIKRKAEETDNEDIIEIRDRLDRIFKIEGKK